jgi:AcrR family transcriptional regulator
VDRVKQIVDAAVELAEEGGFDNVRQREVAARAGVTLRTLYRKFRTKEELLTAAMAREADALEAELARRPIKAPTAEERLSAFFSAMTRVLTRRPSLGKAVVRAMASGASGTVAHVLAFQGRAMALVVGAAAPEPIAPDVVLLLLQIHFACLVGWSADLASPKDVDGQMSRAIGIVLRGAR